MNTGHLTFEQLQQIQSEEQIAFQSQMIEEGIIPQPHIMRTIQQRRLTSQLSNNNDRTSKRHKSRNNKNRTHSANNNVNKSNCTNNRTSLTNKHIGNDDGDGDSSSSSEDDKKYNNDDNDFNKLHNDSNSSSSNSGSNSFKQLQNLKDRNNTLPKQLEESNGRINKLMNSLPSDGMNVDNDKSDSSNGMAIYINVIKQQQLQIEQLMR